MKIKISALGAISVAILAGCGGGGGSEAGGGVTPTEPVRDLVPDPVDGVSRTYLAIRDTNTSETSAISGFVLDGNNQVLTTSGQLNHNAQSLTLVGVSGALDVANETPFPLSDFAYVADVEVNDSTNAIVGIATSGDDMPISGVAAYSGDFGAQFVDSSSTPTILDWTADIQVGFSGSNNVDMTFQGEGSSAIDLITIQNATILGNEFSGGNMTVSNNGSAVAVLEQSVDLKGQFFGYNEVLSIPAEVAGGIVAVGADSALNGVFIAGQ